MNQATRLRDGVDELINGLCFRRSRQPLDTQLEGKVLKATWEHEGHYFAVWEVLRAEPEPWWYEWSGNENDDFFRSHEGAPRVIIDR